jgi:hypothetical protein
MASPKSVKDFLSTKLGTLEHETFCVILLDKRHHLIEYVELFRGTIDGASVHPREVVKLEIRPTFGQILLAALSDDRSAPGQRRQLRRVSVPGPFVRIGQVEIGSVIDSHEVYLPGRK